MASACPWRRASRSAWVSWTQDRLGRRVVVEEHVARRVRDAQLRGQAVADRERRGPAVDEVQAAPAHLLQDLEHGLGLGGGPAAHVVVDARRQRHPVERPVEAAPELVGLETDQDRVRPGIGRADRLHRQVQVDLVAAGACRGGQLGEIVGVGQERQRHRHAAAGSPAATEPIAGPRSSITMASCGPPAGRRGWAGGTIGVIASAVVSGCGAAARLDRQRGGGSRGWRGGDRQRRRAAGHDQAAAAALARGAAPGPTVATATGGA